LTGIYIGTGDLNMSMGKGMKGDGLHPDVKAAMELILQACASGTLWQESRAAHLNRPGA
jgi:2-keto-3-deoxy-L-rhamnonate aldolase RhmA